MSVYLGTSILTYLFWPICLDLGSWAAELDRLDHIDMSMVLSRSQLRIWRLRLWIWWRWMVHRNDAWTVVLSKHRSLLGKWWWKVWWGPEQDVGNWLPRTVACLLMSVASLAGCGRMNGLHLLNWWLSLGLKRGIFFSYLCPVQFMPKHYRQEPTVSMRGARFQKRFRKESSSAAFSPCFQWFLKAEPTTLYHKDGSDWPMSHQHRRETIAGMVDAGEIFG